MTNHNYYFPVSELVKPNNPGFKCKEDFLVDPNTAVTSNIVQQHNNLNSVEIISSETNEPRQLNEQSEVNENNSSHVDSKTIVKKNVNNYYYKNPARVISSYGWRRPSYIKVIEQQNFSGILVLLLVAIFIVLLIKRN